MQQLVLLVGEEEEVEEGEEGVEVEVGGGGRFSSSTLHCNLG